MRIFVSSEYSRHANFFSDGIFSTLTDTAKLLEKFLKRALERRGAKAKLAADCGVSPTTVTDWANGKYSPSVSQLGKIASSLGISVGALFLESDQPRQTGTRTSESTGTTGDSDDATPQAAAGVLSTDDEGPMLEAVRSVRQAIGESMAKLVDVETRLTATREATGGKVGRTRVRSNR